MWAQVGETVSYIDNSSVQAVDYHWFIPGADATELETQDADAVYNTSGIYPFPTMTVKDGAGQTYTYTAPGKLKVGGKGERFVPLICCNWVRMPKIRLQRL